MTLTASIAYIVYILMLLPTGIMSGTMTVGTVDTLLRYWVVFGDRQRDPPNRQVLIVLMTMYQTWAFICVLLVGGFALVHLSGWLS